GVDQIEVLPAILLGRNDNLAFAQVADEPEGVMVNERGFGVLVVNGPRLSGVAIDLDDAETLMAAVRLLVGEMPAVLLPARPGRTFEVDAFRVGLGGLLCLQVVNVHLVSRELVAWLRI